MFDFVQIQGGQRFQPLRRNRLRIPRGRQEYIEYFEPANAPRRMCLTQKRAKGSVLQRPLKWSVA